MFTREWQSCLVFLAIVFGSLSISATVHAQDHSWSQSFGVWADDWSYSVVCDRLGNVILTGKFGQNVSFGGRPLICPEGEGIFLAKYDADGNHIWSQGFVGSSGFGSYSAAVDTLGNVIITGYFSDTLDFGGGSLTSAGLTDIFLAKFDAAGNHIWSQRFGSESLDVCYSAATDALGNVIVTGGFAETVDFGGGPLTSNGYHDIFIAKYDADGNHIWSQSFGDSESQSGGNVAIDATGNVIVEGNLEGTADFGGGPLTSNGLIDIFLVKFDEDGNHIWSQKFGGSDFEVCRSIATNASGDLFITGYFRRTLDFGGGYLASAGDEDIFLAKFDENGNHIWSQRFGDSTTQRSHSVAADASGNVVITGMFNGTVDFGSGSLSCNGYHDIFIAKYDADGNPIWSQGFGDESWQEGYGVATDALENVIVTGWFYSAVDFGGGLLTTWGSNDDYDSRDIFLAKFGSDVTSGDTPLQTASISQNFPNPFNPSTIISYTVQNEGFVELLIYSTQGILIKTLVSEQKQAGKYSISWDGKNNRGVKLPSGVYFYTLRAGDMISSKKMVLLK